MKPRLLLLALLLFLLHADRIDAVRATVSSDGRVRKSKSKSKGKAKKAKSAGAAHVIIVDDLEDRIDASSAAGPGAVPRSAGSAPPASPPPA